MLDSTFFTFNNVCYRQIYGTPMGFLLSSIIDLVMQDLVIVALESLPFNLPFYYRYVNDIILMAPMNSLNLVLQTFNSQHGRLQFIMEIEIDKKVSFLDVTFINAGDKLMFDLYRKPFCSRRYLNYHSHYSINHKKGVIFGLTDKIMTLSHPQFHEKNFKETITLLLDNGYSLVFIFSNMHNRFKSSLTQEINKTPHLLILQLITKKYFTVSYVKHTFDFFKSISKKFSLSPDRLYRT